jgi:hypothetical protein
MCHKHTYNMHFKIALTQQCYRKQFKNLKIEI